MRAFLPPSLRHFEPLRVIPGPTARHVPLDYDLVEALRPRLVVDVGSGAANAFFTYCQSLRDHDIDASAYAVEAWREGETGGHPEATFDAINAHGRKHYPGLHYLLKDDPVASHRHFAEGTVDLLRVELGRFAGASADLESWAARVRPGGVLAVHDTQADPVAWTSLAARGPSAHFASGRGLGIVRIGEAPGNGESELFTVLFDPGRAEALAAFYAHAWEHHQLRRQVAKLG